MSDIIIPQNPSDTSVPLYVAAGLSKKESDACYFEVKEVIDSGKNVAEALLHIMNQKQWPDRMKVWAAYNLHREIMRKKVPGPLKGILDQIGF